MMAPVLRRAWVSPFTTRGDFMRDNVETVFRAIETGLLTTRDEAGDWTNTVRITAHGLGVLIAPNLLIGHHKDNAAI